MLEEIGKGAETAAGLLCVRFSSVLTALVPLYGKGPFLDAMDQLCGCIAVATPLDIAGWPRNVRGRSAASYASDSRITRSRHDNPCDSQSTTRENTHFRT